MHTIFSLALSRCTGSDSPIIWRHFCRRWASLSFRSSLLISIWIFGSQVVMVFYPFFLMASRKGTYSRHDFRLKYSLPDRYNLVHTILWKIFFPLNIVVIGICIESLRNNRYIIMRGMLAIVEVVNIPIRQLPANSVVGYFFVSHIECVMRRYFVWKMRRFHGVT